MPSPSARRRTGGGSRSCSADRGVRLLLDEMFSQRLAEALRQRGHDVAAVSERPDLIGKDDPEILATAVAEGRALVTNNARDFAVLCQQMVAAGDEHAGLLLTSDTSLGRGRPALGRTIDALDALLAAHPADDAFRNRFRWVTPIEGAES